MNLRWSRHLPEVINQGFNITVAANFLYMSQPGVSRQLKLLQSEFVDILLRRGNRIVGLDQNSGRRRL